MYVFNNTGGEIEILSVRSESSRTHIKNKIISSGSGFNTKFAIPKMGDSWIVRVTSKNCAFTYKVGLPTVGWVNDISPHVKVQIEEDMTLYLIPENSKTPVDVSTYVDEQGDGFPLKPVETACGETTEQER